MANVTLYVPDGLKRRMDEHEEVSWSSVVRRIVERKLDDLEAADELAKKSRLSADDVLSLSAAVNSALGRHARRLLNENSG